MTRAERTERAFAAPMMVAALLVVPLLALESANLGGAWATVLTVADWAIWTAFLVEAVVMLHVVEDRRAWLRGHPVELVVIVFTVPILSSAFAAIRVLRVLRLLRLLRIARISHVVFSITGLRYAALLAVLTVVAGGEAFSQIEKVPLKDGLYWAATTMTAAAYGELYPKTDSGRLLAVAVMLVGIGLIATLVGAIAERFIVADESEARPADDHQAADVQAQLQAIRAQLARIEGRL